MQIHELLNKFKTFNESGYDIDKHDESFLSKVKMFNQICMIAILILSFTSINAFYKNYNAIVITNIISIIYLVSAIFYLRKTKKYNFLSTFTVNIYGLLFFYMFITGSVSNTGHLWYYTFPLISSFLLGSKKGSLSTSILIIAAIFYFILQNNYSTLAHYSNEVMLRFVPSYLIVFLFSYLFEKNREKNYKIVKSKNKELSNIIDKLEKNKNKMKKLSDDLEQKVIERTIELNNANKKLLKEIELKNKATKIAESAVKLKTEFLAQMSHEIRTPVNSILSYTQLLKDEVINKIPEELRFSFDMIDNGGRRLIRTIDLILNVSELQTGSYEPIIEQTNIIDKILKPLVGEFQSAAKAKNLDLIFFNRLEEYESNFNIDLYTVTQIIANIIDNAIKYTNEGSIEVVTYKTKDDLYCVDIQDTGIGISKKFQESLFEAFTQEEQGYTRKFEGNGLGMALVKEYCKINNIQISVKSETNKGSTFTLSFPKKNVDIKDAA